MDIASGEQVTRIVDDFGEAENPTHGLIAGSIARETYRIKPDDPLSAVGRDPLDPDTAPRRLVRAHGGR